MATFGALPTSSADDDNDEVPETTDHKDKNVLKTSEMSSIFDLKNEFIKRKTAVQSKSTLGREYEAHMASKSSVLTVKKDEKARLRQDASDRKRRIDEHAEALRREDRERIETANRRLKEKADLYDKLAEGDVSIRFKDDTPVDFMVDFGQKKKQRREDERERRRERDDEQEEAASSSRDNVHYDSNWERRVYGVSHVQFSQDAETREKQMDSLNALHEETDAARRKRADADRQRDKLQQMKLKAMRKRLGIKEPTPPPAPELPDLDSIPLPTEKEETVQEKATNRIHHEREWDQGKGRYDTWIRKQRDERDDDFRPPDSYNY